MFKKQRVLKKGFSAIGLLIAITIFAILAIFVLISSQLSQAKARDTRRVSELNALRTALQLYYMDHDGRYPEIDDKWCSLEETFTAEAYCSGLREAIEPYFEEIPGDSLYPWTENGKIYSYQYRSTSSGEEYKIHADLEVGNYYEVYSGGGFIIEYITAKTGPETGSKLP